MTSGVSHGLVLRLVVVKYKREDNVSVESVISKYIVEPKICSVFISKGGWI